ncbi:exported protein of unknown function [Pseudomonas mediterranea]
MALACALALPAVAASCSLVRDLCSFSCALPRCFSSLASSFSASARAWEQAFSKCSSKAPESCWSKCNGVFTGFLVADMVYLLTDVSAAHTRPLLQPPLGHVDSTQDVALQETKNLLRHCRSNLTSRQSAQA